MSYEQLLHDFVDGSLDYHGEMTLFSELQSNEGLRRELKLLMLMQKAARHDVKAFTPAPESHDAIFARLGFSPGLVEGAAQGTHAGSGGSFGTGLVGGIIGALMVGMIVLLSGRWTVVTDGTAPARPAPTGGAATASREGTQGTGSISSGRAGDATSIRGAGNGAAPPAISAGSGTGQRGSATASAAPPSRRSRGAGLRSPHGSGLATASGTGESFGIEPSLASTAHLPHAGGARTLRVEPIVPAAHTTASLGGGSPIPPLDLPEASPLEGASRGSVVMRGIIGRNFSPLPDALAERSNGIMLDRAISLEYRLDVNRRVGVEIGQESFYQRFTEMLPTGDILQHEQSPALFWGGVGFTQLFGDGLGIQPFARGLVGGTRVGPLGRLSIGAEYDMGSNIQLMAGGEIGALAYSFDGAWFVSPKYGFTYGLSMRF